MLYIYPFFLIRNIYIYNLETHRVYRMYIFINMNSNSFSIFINITSMITNRIFVIKIYVRKIERNDKLIVAIYEIYVHKNEQKEEEKN